MRILVTGGTGFIGRHLMRALVRMPERPETVCLVEPARTDAARAFHAWLRQADVRLVEGDLTRPEVSAEPAPAVDVVFHLAANIDTDLPEAAHRVNDVGIAHLLDWLAPSPSCRIVYTSSVAAVDRDRPATGPITEASPCVPRTAYGRTKLHGEEILRTRAGSAGFSVTVLRLATVYGEGQKPGGLFDTLATFAAQGAWLGRIDWCGRTSVVHVSDVVAILWDLAGRPEAANEIYGVASPETLTVADLARHIGSATGHPVRPIRLPAWIWRTVRWVAWRPALATLVPTAAYAQYWRLTLLVDHAFWCETAKLRKVYTRAFVPIDEGLAQTFQGTAAASSRRSDDNYAHTEAEPAQ